MSCIDSIRGEDASCGILRRAVIFIRTHREVFVLLFLWITGAIVLLYNLDHYYLWGDEGETAFLGKNTLKFGLPYAFDGRNLYEFRNGFADNRDFLLPLSPWLQYYVVAFSFALFGFTTFAARALFSFFATFIPLVQYLFVRQYFHNQRLAFFNALVMMTSTSYLLFCRQSRYFAIIMFLGTLVAYFYVIYEDRPSYRIGVYCLFMVMVAANYLLAIPFLAAMGISCFLFDDRHKSIRFFLLPFILVTLCEACLIVWLMSRGGPNNPEVLRNLHPMDFLRVFWLYLKDYNLTQLLPVGSIVLTILFRIQRGFFRSNDLWEKSRKELTILCTIILFTIFLSVLSPESRSQANSNIRYAVVIFPFLLLVQALAVEEAYLWRKWAGVVLLFVLIGTNVLTFTPFRSYFYEYVRENVRPFDNSVKVAVRFLTERSSQDQKVLVSPNHMMAPFQFYLGDRLLISHVIGEDNKNLLAAGVSLPRHLYSSEIVPDWVVLFGPVVDMPHTYRQLQRLNFSEYRVHTLPIFGPDVSRPEVFWRSFTPIVKYPQEWSLIILERVSVRD